MPQVKRESRSNRTARAKKVKMQQAVSRVAQVTTSNPWLPKAPWPCGCLQRPCPVLQLCCSGGVQVLAVAVVSLETCSCLRPPPVLQASVAITHCLGRPHIALFSPLLYPSGAGRRRCAACSTVWTLICGEGALSFCCLAVGGVPPPLLLVLGRELSGQDSSPFQLPMEPVLNRLRPKISSQFHVHGGSGAKCWLAQSSLAEAQCVQGAFSGVTSHRPPPPKVNDLAPLHLLRRPECHRACLSQTLGRKASLSSALG